MINFDLPEQFDQSCFEDINDALVEAQVLAARVAILRSEGASFADLHRATYQDVMNISDVLNMYDEDAVFAFTGDGFVPVYDYENEDFKTAFANVSGRGKFSSFALLDPTDIKFIGPEEDDDDEGGEEFYYTDVKTEEVESVIDNERLRVPQAGYNLYLEFELKRRTDYEQVVGGIAMRSYDTATYNIMDLARLTIDHIELSKPVTQVPEFDIVETMLDAAEKVRNMKRDTAFRRQNKKHQINYLDTTVDDLNDTLGLERVSMGIEAPHFFVSASVAGDRRVYKVVPADPDDIQVIITPIRIDCLDSYNVSQGKRITNDKRMVSVGAGLYVVGKVEDHIAELMQLPSSVVWIPLADKKSEDFSVIPIHYSE
jgi:hypothetical protein